MLLLQAGYVFHHASTRSCGQIMEGQTMLKCTVSECQADSGSLNIYEWSQRFDIDEPIWKGRQWAVTSYGLETWCHAPYHYHIRRDWLWQRTPPWEEHMAEKDWVDVADFTRAMVFALRHFGADSVA